MKRRQFIKGSAILGLSLAKDASITESGMYDGDGQRKVYKILNSHGVNVGTLPVMRAFAGDHLDYVSPFVLFDEFGPVQIKPGQDALKVEAHPHAGVTPTTYFLQGSGHHKDSLNYDFQIEKGDFMMFSSGKGAIHMEESGDAVVKNGGVVHGFQIWLNTPSAYKFADPYTIVNQVSPNHKIETDNYSIQVVLGDYGDITSHIELHSPAFYYHVKMKDNTRLDIPTDPNHNAFIYLIDGDLELEGKKKLMKNQVALYHRGQKDISLYSICSSEILILGGQPLNETVYSYGPFVMNNREQIMQCIQNYESGKMGDAAIVNKS